MSTAGFVMVPGWLIDLKPSGRAIHAYVTLALYGRISVAELAEDMGVSGRTALRAMNELVSAGAVVRTLRFGADGRQLPPLYRIVFGAIEAPEGGCSSI